MIALNISHGNVILSPSIINYMNAINLLTGLRSWAADFGLYCRKLRLTPVNAGCAWEISWPSVERHWQGINNPPQTSQELMFLQRFPKIDPSSVNNIPRIQKSPKSILLKLTSHLRRDLHADRACDLQTASFRSHQFLRGWTGPFMLGKRRKHRSWKERSLSRTNRPR